MLMKSKERMCLDLNQVIQPHLLTHPNIPKPLHGLSPRTLLGKNWWDEKRYKAYAKHDYHCWACGIHKLDAKYHQWLEGHECYIINYKDGIMELKEIVALCHSCHNFIHSGRLLQLSIKGDIGKAKALDILNHGFHILLANRLKPFVAAIICWCSLMGYNNETILELSKRAMPLPMDFAEWNDWHLIIEGKKYYSLFKDIDDWRKHYQGFEQKV